MRKKLLKTCIGVFLLAVGLAFTSCLEVPEEEKAPSLEYELLDNSYAVVGMGDYEDGRLIIPAEYNGKPVTAIAAEAFAYETEIGIVTIPDSVTTIGQKAFYTCKNITQITMGKGVTDIADSAFAYCTNVEEVTGGDSVVSLGTSAFNGCAKLKKVGFGEKVNVISKSAFEGCSKLQSFDFGENLELIGERAFYECIELDGVEIPNGLSSDIMDSAFFGCENVRYVRLGNGVISIGNSAFEGCSLVREVVIGDGVVTIGKSAFSTCRKFYQITIGASVMSIGEGAFTKCWLIREIYNRSSLSIRLKTKDNGELGYYAWCVRLNDESTRISKDENGLVYYTDGARKALIAVELTTHTELVVPDDVTEIGDYACYSEQLITGLVIGDGCTKIGESAFRNSYKINKLVLGESVTTIGDAAFRYNGYIVTIVINKNLQTVGKEAFMKKVGDRYYKPYQTIYFEGTKEEWNITFAEGNDHLLAETVKVAYYSEEEPASKGSSWHYVDGKPTLWE